MQKETAAEANRLYWETETSVADIAAQLDVSRRALYEMLDPMNAGPCPQCGGPTYFANRSARDAGTSVCGTCATTSPQELTAAEAEPWTWSPGISREGTRRPLASERGARARRIQLAAVIGVILGATVTHLLVKKD